MTLASSSSVTLTGIEETVFGVTPVAGNPFTLRVTGETLDYTISKESSKEINSNRTVASVIPTTASVTGNISAEFSYSTFDTLLRSALQGAWVAFGTNGVGASVTADFTTATITAAVAPTGNNAFTLLQKGQFFSVGGVGLNSGKILRVSPVTAPTSTVITLDPNTPAVASTAESVTLSSSRLTHGTTQTSFSLQRRNQDVNVFTVYKGCTPSKFSLNVASAALTSFTVDFMGKKAEADNVSLLPGVPTDPTSFEIHSGVFGATTAVWMNGAPLTGTFIKSVALSYDNTLRSQEAIGTLGAVGIGSGTIACTVTASIYFADKTLFDKYVKNINTSLMFASSDAAGNGYMFSLPNSNITSFKSNASAKDQDQMAEITFTVLEDRANLTPALRKLIFIDRFGTAVAP